MYPNEVHCLKVDSRNLVRKKGAHKFKVPSPMLS
jgi:hypothetical protein